MDIPTAFQPRDANGQLTGVTLQWRVFAPTPAPQSGQGPAVLLLHEGGFYTGNIISGNLTDPENDLTHVGYYVFVAAFRLAPCGLIQGQACHNDPTSGRPPQQTDDVKAFVRAMRADSRCNGNVEIVGGSAGASHAAFVALDKSSTSIWPFWNSGGNDDRPDAVVCLSGAYDFADRTPENYPTPPGDPVANFQNLIENYTNTCVRIDPNNGPSQRTVSPIALVTPSTPTNFKPMLLINSQYDFMPFHQIIDMECALTSVLVDPSLYQVMTIPLSSEHAFAYWGSLDGVTVDSPVLIRDDVIGFLNSHLK